MVRKLLQAQNKIRNNKQLPEELRKIQLINQEELDQIRKIWFYDKLETDDVCFLKFVKQKLKENIILNL